MAPRIRSASLAGYVELANSLGLPARQMMREAGLDPRCVDNPETLIEVMSVRTLLEASAQAAGMEDFGLRLVAQRRLSNLGPISLVLRDEPTGRQALDTLCRYMRLLNESLITRIEEGGGLLIIREEFLLPMPGSIRQSMELAVGVMHSLLRELLGPDWEPRRVCFAHRPPANLATHVRVFGRFVSFNAEFNGIVCASADLERRIERADPMMARMARQALDNLQMAPEVDMLDRVRQLILATLPSGRCTVEQVAHHLKVDRRTIHRHLARSGETFSSALGAVRADLAMRHVTEGNRALSDVAELLGFASLSAFSRWFRERFGMSASQWRESAN
jgi:AraC-like DNA-binding protein